MTKTTRWKIVLTAGAVIAALSGGAAVYAQGDKPQPGAGMMHGSGNMMNMMGQMSQMMESCNKMMQDMRPSQETAKPKAKPTPEKTN